MGLLAIVDVWVVIFVNNGLARVHGPSRGWHLALPVFDRGLAVVTLSITELVLSVTDLSCDSAL